MALQPAMPGHPSSLTRPVSRALYAQARSLGAEFLTVAVQESGEGAGGYAKQMSPAFLEAEASWERCRVLLLACWLLRRAVPAPHAPLAQPSCPHCTDGPLPGPGQGGGHHHHHGPHPRQARAATHHAWHGGEHEGGVGDRCVPCRPPLLSSELPLRSRLPPLRPVHLRCPSADPSALPCSNSVPTPPHPPPHPAVDLAAEQGGNVETTVPGQVVQHGAVTCIGEASRSMRQQQQRPGPRR